MKTALIFGSFLAAGAAIVLSTPVSIPAHFRIREGRSEDPRGGLQSDCYTDTSFPCWMFINPFLRCQFQNSCDQDLGTCNATTFGTYPKSDSVPAVTDAYTEDVPGQDSVTPNGTIDCSIHYTCDSDCLEILDVYFCQATAVKANLFTDRVPASKPAGDDCNNGA